MDIFSQMRRMHEDVDRLFGSLWDVRPGQQLLPGKQDAPRQALSDIYETEKEIVAKIDLPGVDKKEIEINVMDDGIEIKAEKHVETETNEQGWYRKERSYGGYYRYLPLPEHADAAKIEATSKNGVLELHIPKKEQKPKKRIEVR